MSLGLWSISADITKLKVCFTFMDMHRLTYSNAHAKSCFMLFFFFSGDEAVMNTNAPKAEGLEEVKSAAGSDVRNLKSKVSIVCFMYKMPHYKQIELKTRFYNLLRLIQ